MTQFDHLLAALLLLCVWRNCGGVTLSQENQAPGHFTSPVKITAAANAAQPQVFNLLVDTAQPLSYIPCSTCNATLCGAKTSLRLQPSTQIPCASPSCTGIGKKVCPPSGHCAVSSVYAGDITLTLDVIQPTICIDTSCYRAVAGCIVGIDGPQGASGSFADSPFDGVLGLSRNSSFARQLGVFRLELSGQGRLDTKVPSAELRSLSDWVPMVENAGGKYVIDLESVQVASTVVGTKLTLEINTGSAFSWFPSAVFNAMRSQWFSYCRDPNRCVGRIALGLDRQSLACYHVRDKGALQTFPKLFLVLSKKLTLTLSPEMYMFKAALPTGSTPVTTTPYCVGIFKDPALTTEVIAGAQLLQLPTVFDLQGQRIGFQGAQLQSQTGGQAATIAPTPFEPIPISGSQSAGGGVEYVFKNYFLSFMIGIAVCFLPCMCLRRRYARKTGATYDKIDVSEEEMELTERMGNGTSDYAYEIGDATEDESSDDDLGTFDIIAEDDEDPTSPRETREQLLERAENLFERSSGSAVDRA